MNLTLKKYLVAAVLTWASSVAVASLVYAVFIAPQNRCRKQLARQLAEKQELYEEALTATLSVARKQMEDELLRMREKFDDFAVEVDKLAHLTFDISRIASEHSLASFTIKDTGDWKNSSVPGCDHIAVNHIDLTFAGTFGQFATFLNALERHRPVVFIDRFSITRGAKGSAGHAVSLKLAVLVKAPQST
jgi:hypothetical protein